MVSGYGAIDVVIVLSPLDEVSSRHLEFQPWRSPGAE